MTFDIVRRLGLKLAGTQEGTAYGSPALKVDGKMFACLAINKSAEPNSLAVSIDFRERDELLAADPHTYYVTDHYVDHPIVLIRLARVRGDALKDLLRMAHRFVTATHPRSISGRRRKSPRGK